jgi:hypothetical protein
MTRFVGIAGLYALMVLAWIAAGAFLLFMPMRAGNLIHDSFGLFPEVHPKDHAKKTLLRIAGIGLLAFAANFLHNLREVTF